MQLPFCKICGERHRLGFCPEFAEFEPPTSQSRPVEAPIRTEPQPASDFGIAPPTEQGSLSEGERPPEAGGAEILSPPRRPRNYRPLDKDRPNCLAAREPWKAEGLSRATWFRRQHEQAQ